MKTRSIALLLCVSMAVLASGCGRTSDTESVTETEAVTETETSEQLYANEIAYTALDYVTLGEYNGIEVTVEGDYTVTDEDVVEEVNAEIESAGDYLVETEKTVVEEGDFANIDYVGKLDGVAFDGGTASGYDLEIGSGTFIDGFEDGLIGVSVGETVDLELTFPEDYSSEDLAGQTVIFTVTVNSIKEAQEVTYDTLTDDYVSSMMNYDTVDEYLEAVRTSLEETMESTKESDTQTAVLEALVANSTINGYPDGIIELRVQQQLEYYEKYASYYGVDLETYLSAMGTSVDEYTALLEENMSSSVDKEMVLLAIAETEGFDTDEEAYAAYVANIVESNGFTDEETLFEMYAEDYVKRMYCQDTAMDFAIENAVVTYVAADESVEETEAE